MLKYNVFKLLILLATIGLAACGTKAASTALPSLTVVPPTNTPEPIVTMSFTPTPRPDPAAFDVDNSSFTKVSDVAVNLYFSYPDDWLVEHDDMGDELTYLIASNDTLLDGLDVGESGGVVRIAVEDTENWISTVKDQRRPLEGLVALYESIIVDNIDIIQTPVSLRINGLEAATTSFYMNDEARFMSLTFFLSGEQSVTVISEVSADEEAVYSPILEAITESIYVPEEFSTYQLATRQIPILFRFPVSWSSRPYDDDGIIVGPYEVVSTGELGDEAMHVINWVDLGFMIPPQDMLETIPDPFTIIERGDVIKETELLTINGWEAARALYNGRFLDNDVILVYTVIAAEPYMIASFGITAVVNENIMVPIHAEITDSIVLQEGLIDFSDPGSVVEAIFIAAQTEDFGILPYLCDPHGEADEDVKDICSITSDREQRDEFVDFFATAEINGEIVIDGYSAFVPFVFGSNKDQTETMELVRRNQLWYLLGF